MLLFFPFDTSIIFSNKRSWIKLRKSKEIGRHSYDNQVKKKDNSIKAVLRWSLANLAGVKNECKISAKQKHAYLIMAGTQLHSLQEEESEDGEKFSNLLIQKWESWENCTEDFTFSSCVTLSSFFIYIAYKKYFFLWNISFPARVLLVDYSPPFDADTCEYLHDTLVNFFSLVTHLSGPCRTPFFGLIALTSPLEVWYD